MITLPNGMELRNLQEQVLKNKEDIARHYEVQRVLEDYGIQIVGSVETAEQLPDPLTYTGSFGDGYTVGPEGGPLTFYIYTRPNEAIGETTNRWLDLGSLAIAGPEGPMGPQGERGPAGTSNRWYVNTKVPVGSGYKEGDMCLLVGSTNVLGQIYTYKANQWNYVSNIRGPQGPIGPEGKTGPRGPQGIQGPVGPRGAPAPIVEILSMLDDINQLPDPSTVDPNAGFLINEDGATYLYIIINGVWANSGRWGGGTSVYSKGEFVENFDADTKLSVQNYPDFAVIPLATKSGTISGPGGYLYKDTSLGNGPATVGGGSVVPTYYANTVTIKEDSYKNRYICTGTPTQAMHCANKKYVDEKIAAAHEGGFQPHARLFAVATQRNI